ncbi:MAG: DUF2332 family protein [Gammaproteobacteria bacterium]
MNSPVPSVSPERLAAAREHCRTYVHSLRQFHADLYVALNQRIVEDDEILGLVAQAPATQPVVQLFLTAVHYLLMARPEDPLAAYFPTLAEGAKPPVDAWPDFRRFCLAHAAELAALVSDGALQATTVERGFTLLLPMDRVARRAGAPLSVIEIGPSVGINLRFDAWTYDFGAGGVLGDPRGPVRIGMEFRGQAPQVPARIPAVAWRAGIDLHRVDAADAAARRWMQASLYPEWADMIRNLGAALEHCARTPVRILEGDVIRLLPDLAAEAPDPLCLVHMNTLYQWPTPLREALEAMIRDLSRARTVHRISVETRPGMTYAERYAIYARGEEIPADIHTMCYRGGEEILREHVGRCHAYARWMQWSPPSALA